MKKALFVCLLLSNLAFSQNDLEFRLGYYVVNSSAEYTFQSLPSDYCCQTNSVPLSIDIVKIENVSPWDFENFEEGISVIEDELVHLTKFEDISPEGFSYHLIYYNVNQIDQNQSLLNLSLNRGELIMLDEIVNDVYIGRTINGAKVFIKGKNSVSKTQEGVGYCQLKESIDFIDGSFINAGTNYWVISQNIANSTVRIQIQDGKSLDVPQSKISLTSAIVKREIQASNFKKVE